MKMNEGSAGEREGRGSPLVTPGESLGTVGDRTAGHGVLETESGMIATKTGYLNDSGTTISVDPVYARYTPRPGDLVIGVVESVRNNLWFVDVNGPFNALLPMSLGPGKADFGGARQVMDVGASILCRVQDVEATGACVVTMKGLGLRKIQSGIVEEMPPHMIARAFGNGDALQQLKAMSDCRIIPAENGRIWVEGTSIGQQMIRNILRTSMTDGGRITSAIESMAGGGN